MVRSKAQLLLMKILERDVVSAQQLFDKLTPSFAHKNGRIREEVLTTLVTTINEYVSRNNLLFDSLCETVIFIVFYDCKRLRLDSNHALCKWQKYDSITRRFE